MSSSAVSLRHDKAESDRPFSDVSYSSHESIFVALFALCDDSVLDMYVMREIARSTCFPMEMLARYLLAT